MKMETRAASRGSSGEAGRTLPESGTLLREMENTLSLGGPNTTEGTSSTEGTQCTTDVITDSTRYWERNQIIYCHCAYNTDS